MSNSINNKRIAKNTLFLYVRMAINMAVMLYTSRVLLRVLGVDDYGLYNVIGGVVVLFTFLNSSMGSSTSRFITFALGKGDSQELNHIFSASLTNHCLIAAIIVILAETLGLYLVMNKLIIPADRYSSALWVYQFSIITCAFTLTQVPYNASIIAHENMNAFAFLSIGETMLKLICVILLQFIDGYDKLVLYAILVSLVTFLISLSYRVYCKKSFQECTYHFTWNTVLYKRLFSYSGWDLLGNISGIAQGQGLNVLLNVFFGPAVNAARAVSVQVQSALSQFSGNFLMAVRPQIIKAYAENKIEEMMSLVYSSAKYAFALILLFSVPIFLEMNYILHLWLEIVPNYSIQFCRIMLLVNIVNVLRNPFIAAFHATGHIQLGNMICGSLLISTLPFSYMALKHGASPISVFLITLAISFLVQWAELFILKKYLDIPLITYLKRLLFPSLALSILVIPFVYVLREIFAPSLLRLILVCLGSLFAVSIGVYFVTMTSETRKKINQIIAGKLGICRN